MGYLNGSPCYHSPVATATRRESRLMAGPKNAQVVVRMPSTLLEAVKAHERAMQAERPFERTTTAMAIRDLLARGLASAAKPKRR